MMRELRRYVWVLGGLAVWMGGCQLPVNVEEPPEPQRTITGTVRIATGTGTHAIREAGARELGALADRPLLVPGEVIVRFAPTVRLQGAARLEVNGTPLEPVRPLALEGAFLYRAGGVDAEATRAAARALAARPGVLWAQPNYRIYPLLELSDPFFDLQWHYSAINLPQAWEVTQGSSAVVVAVIDTGVLRAHPDFAGRLLAGYDFISDPQVAADGDGRDPDPEDPGDNPGGQSSYHGSHVAGTIGAATNNGLGVAGVDWKARILPLRVLGVGGGSTADIIDAILWAVGVSLPPVPDNPNPAQVLNLSLGGAVPCSETPAFQAAFDEAISRGAIVVVAAGNEDRDASNFSPASCGGVITVGATDLPGNRAFYSNFGLRVDVMAPGGDTGVDLNSDGFVDGVLSLNRDDADGTFDYRFLQGTSMAAPHVAGVVALMKALEPSLTPVQALDLLKQTARPLSASACNRPSAAECGAGLIDAQAALSALQAAPTPDYTLSLAPGVLELNPGEAGQVAVTLTRSGGFSEPVTLSLGGAPAGVTGGFSPNPAAGTTSTLTLSVDAAAPLGSFGLLVRGAAAGTSKVAALTLTISGTGGGPDVLGTVVFACFYVPDPSVVCDPSRTRFVVIASGGSVAPYAFAGLEAGGYVLLAWQDANGSGDVDSGDYAGVFLRPGELLSLIEPPAAGIDIPMELLQDTAPSVRALLQKAIGARRTP
ncbi:S8 family serine peptidase [Marinithermus hydrothermalis]|uniref:Peptidase S8 and S53 subtilisin kexin sedolisin n=1 Tax=Marinithermus hydrothermalis (strain DSM 14884 / JCM 11576 / T1) TaxID=869210 RepID=F2NPA2_MARHT|nr:S8 family serine peptidase [Marinithermus hydrothermalis]AEB11903.1 peptidase S8 and S53 subtilisin kexin sedolisin [Marinithermus hydrothermalis DSM 14884]